MIKVLVHFGPPKTGTSSIQQWLVTHQQLLQSKGIYYPDHSIDENGVSSGNVRALFNIENDEFTFSTEKLNDLMRRAHQSDASLLLLSSEFFMRYIVEIAKYIPQAHFFGFVRFPLDNIESNYNQGIKRKFTTEKLKTSLTPRAPVLDIVESAVTRIGAHKFTLVPFEKSLFVKGDLVATFLSHLGIENVETANAVVNTSYCFEALEVKRWFNQFRANTLQGPLDKFLQGYNEGTKQYSLIAPDDYQKIKLHHLARTQRFIDVVECKQGEAFLQALRATSQKPYKPQVLSDEAFVQVMRAWLTAQPQAKAFIEAFVKSARPTSQNDKQKLQLLSEVSAEFTTTSHFSWLNGGESFKNVRKAMSLSKLKSFRRSGINQLTWRSAIDKWQYENQGKSLPVHQEVEWISHHIPKTAGSSLRKSLDKAYGKEAVYGVYRLSGANEITRGQNIWIPKETKVIHGHFATHANQATYFPNAKRLAWVRDPIDRAWSLLGRLLDIKDRDPLYSQLKAKYIDKGITDKAELFECWLKDTELKRPLNDYKRYFRAVDIADFNFIGSMHSMDQDLARLSELLGIKLVAEQRNIRAAAKDLPARVRQLAPLFDAEYEIVADYLHKDV